MVTPALNAFHTIEFKELFLDVSQIEDEKESLVNTTENSNQERKSFATTEEMTACYSALTEELTLIKKRASTQGYESPTH